MLIQHVSMKDGGFDTFQTLVCCLVVDCSPKILDMFPIGYPYLLCIWEGKPPDYDCFGSLIYFQTIRVNIVEGIHPRSLT